MYCSLYDNAHHYLSSNLDEYTENVYQRDNIMSLISVLVSFGVLLQLHHEMATILYHRRESQRQPDRIQYSSHIDDVCILHLLVVFGKSEGRGTDWHGHVSAVSVSPLYRRLGMAGKMMRSLEKRSEEGDMYFVDLFVRVSNKAAIRMYEGLGYTVYRRILGYYCDPDEDAFGMSASMTNGLILMCRYEEGAAEGC